MANMLTKLEKRLTLYSQNMLTKVGNFIVIYLKNYGGNNFVRDACHHHPTASIGITLKCQLWLTKTVNFDYEYLK